MAANACAVLVGRAGSHSLVLGARSNHALLQSGAWEAAGEIAKHFGKVLVGEAPKLIGDKPSSGLTQTLPPRDGSGRRL